MSKPYRTTRILTVLALLLAASPSASAAARPLEFNRGMTLILDEYLRVYLALSRAGSGYMARPTERAVKRAARRLHRLANRLLSADRAGGKLLSPRRRWLLETIAKAGATMSWARHLTRQRASMARLSRAMATWAVRADLKQVSVVYFANRQQVWLQRGKELRSPYFGFGAGVEALSGLVVAGEHKGLGTGLSHPSPDDANQHRTEQTGNVPPTLPSYLQVE